MDADRPVTSREHDRLGFAPIAEHLASVIADTSAKDGLVLGIEGSWGSGKSSIISLTKEALTRRENSPEIVDFAPWLVGPRDTLLGSLFAELGIAAAKIDPTDQALAEQARIEGNSLRSWYDKLRSDELWKLKKKEEIRKKIGKQLDAFGLIAGFAGKAAKVAGDAGVPIAGHVGSAIEGSITLLSGQRTLAKQKAALVAALRQIARPIVVFVDDLDRLEPREAAEVLRLIRAVADFPNVIYILSYDPKVVSKLLEKAIQVDDGAAFLEKIVQASFRVPRPQAFDLRLWFRAEVERLFASSLGNINAYRFTQAIDVQGGQYLSRPRDVVRALNSLRLHAIPVRDKIDIPDMIWLQLIRIGKPALYEWIEEYMTNVAAIAGGAQISNEAAQFGGQRLAELLRADGVDLDRARIDVATILPGIGDAFRFGRGEDRPIYGDLGGDRLAPFIRDRRLGSPEHFRFYFAFAEPAGALTDDVIKTFIAAAERAPLEAAAQFQQLITQERPQGGSMAEVLISRLIAETPRIPLAAIPGIVSALAQHMDRFASIPNQTEMGRPRAWPPAEYLTRKLFNATDPQRRTASIESLFARGQSLGWITSILRSEIFAHGRFGDRPEPADQWLLTGEEFDAVLPAMLRRYEEADPDRLLNTPELVSLLYGWSQGGGEEAARNWVAARTETDRGLLDFLSRARGWRASNDRVYYPLSRQDIGRFMNFDEALRRLQQIADNVETRPEDRQRARDLLQAAQLDRDDD